MITTRALFKIESRQEKVATLIQIITTKRAIKMMMMMIQARNLFSNLRK